MFAAAIAGALISSADRAEACSGEQQRPTVIFPDNLTVSPFTHVLLNASPFGLTGELEIDEIPRSGRPRRASVEIETLRLVGFSNLLVVRPSTQWNSGSRYTINIAERDVRLELGAFEVNGDIRIPAISDPTHITWFDQYFEERRGDTCVGVISRSYVLDLSFFPEVLPEGSFVQLIARGRNGSGPATQEAAVLSGGASTVTIEEGFFTFGFEPECIEAWVVGLDGTRSKSIETCEPYLCALLPKDAPRDTVDWEQVDGCKLDCTLGDRGYTCTEIDGPIDPTDPAPRDLTPDERLGFTSGRGCACSARSGETAAPDSESMVAGTVVMLLLLGRSRRRVA